MCNGSDWASTISLQIEKENFIYKFFIFMPCDCGFLKTQLESSWQVWEQGSSCPQKASSPQLEQSISLVQVSFIVLYELCWFVICLWKKKRKFQIRKNACIMIEGCFEIEQEPRQLVMSLKKNRVVWHWVVMLADGPETERTHMQLFPDDGILSLHRGWHWPGFLL